MLDGGWDRRSRDEDADAIRRLYYVAITRARQGLILARMQAGNPLIDGLADGPYLVRREGRPTTSAPPELARCYERLTLRDVDLSYAGRQPAGALVHRAIAELAVGDALQVRFGKSIELVDDRGRIVGRLAKRYEPPKGMTVVSANVTGIVRRDRDSAEPEYQRLLKSEVWEVVVPEFVFAWASSAGISATA